MLHRGLPRRPFCLVPCVTVTHKATPAPQEVGGDMEGWARQGVCLLLLAVAQPIGDTPDGRSQVQGEGDRGQEKDQTLWGVSGMHSPRTVNCNMIRSTLNLNQASLRQRDELAAVPMLMTSRPSRGTLLLCVLHGLLLS